MKSRHALMAALAGMSLFCAGTQAANVLVNPGFETGNLAPWFADAGSPTVSNADAHTGVFSAAAFGGDSIRQNFAPIATNQITEVSFWAHRPPFPFDQYSFYYSDAPTFTNVVLGNGGSWEFFNITAQLTPNAHLTGFSIFGTSSGPAFLDDFTINLVPEPSALCLSLLGLAGLATRRSRWRMQRDQ
jgi:hypothetical protein